MMRLPGMVGSPLSNSVGAALDIEPEKLSQGEKLVYEEGIKKGEANVSNHKWYALVGGAALGFLGGMVVAMQTDSALREIQKEKRAAAKKKGGKSRPRLGRKPSSSSRVIDAEYEVL